MMKPFKEQEDLYPRPDGYDGKQNGVPQADELPVKLNDNQVVEAYKVPWAPDGYHLTGAGDDFVDAVWGIQDGRRDVRMLKTVKEMK